MFRHASCNQHCQKENITCDLISYQMSEDMFSFVVSLPGDENCDHGRIWSTCSFHQATEGQVLAVSSSQVLNLLSWFYGKLNCKPVTATLFQQARKDRWHLTSFRFQNYRLDTEPVKAQLKDWQSICNIIEE